MNYFGPAPSDHLGAAQNANGDNPQGEWDKGGQHNVQLALKGRENTERDDLAAGARQPGNGDRHRQINQ